MNELWGNYESEISQTGRQILCDSLYVESNAKKKHTKLELINREQTGGCQR